MNHFQHLFAIILTFLWGNWNRYVKGEPKKIAFMWGRRISPEPIKCSNCRWKGMVRQLVHTYESDGENFGYSDVVPVDECPRCREYL